MSANSPTGNRQSDLAVMDINEFKQKRRLQRILDTHDQVEEHAQNARQQYVAGEISHHARNMTIFNAVRRYIREVTPVLLSSAGGLDRITYSEEVGQDNPIGRVEFEAQQDSVFWTLDDYYNAEEMYFETITEHHTTRHGPDKTMTYEVQHSVPVEASWQAYVLVNIHLAEQQGIEIQMEELEVDEHADPF